MKNTKVSLQSFIIRYLRLIQPFIILLCLSPGCTSKDTVPASEHILLDQIGEEHIANAVYRRIPGGGTIVGWGDRILEWSIQSPGEKLEVVPTDKEFIYSNGGCAMDIDGDGTDEIVVGKSIAPNHQKPELYWFKAVIGSETWEEHIIGGFDTGSWTSPHDIVPFEASLPDGGTIRGIVTVIGRKDVYLFIIPDDPEEMWQRHDIASFSGPRQSGITVGDIDGDTRPDVVCGMYWMKCPKDPRSSEWQQHRFGEWDENNWGGMAEHVLCDIDKDGAMDIIATEAEIPDSRLGIFMVKTASGESLRDVTIIDSTLYCPHSLVIDDFTNDGLDDIVVGEMTAGGWDFPLNESPRIYLFINRGKLGFERIVLEEGWGVHEMKLAPEDFNGYPMLYSADEIQPHKFKGMNTHVSCWLIGESGEK